jgi:hypothetical protein
VGERCRRAPLVGRHRAEQRRLGPVRRRVRHATCPAQILPQAAGSSPSAAVPGRRSTTVSR